MSELKNPVRMSLREAFVLIGRSLELGKLDNAMALLGDLEPQIMAVVEEVERLREREAGAAGIIEQGIAEYDLLKAEVERLNAESTEHQARFARCCCELGAEMGKRERAERERDKITRLLLVESLAKDDSWYVQEDLPPKVKGRYRTFKEAVAVVRKAAGLVPGQEGHAS